MSDVPSVPDLSVAVRVLRPAPGKSGLSDRRWRSALVKDLTYLHEDELAELTRRHEHTGLRDLIIAAGWQHDEMTGCWINPDLR